MKSAAVERGLWGLASVAILATVVEVRGVAATGIVAARPLPAAPLPPRRPDPDSVGRAVEYVVANDPFRLSRQPATVPYAPALEGLAPPPTARPPRPTLVLRGIVGGPPWSAILDGLPGREGSALVRRGDTVGTILVRAVGRDTVIIQGADTTWRLTVKRAW